MAQRPRGKPYEGYWEFPGGKVEPGEQPLEAVRRELHEELGIDVIEAYPWITRNHRYEHADVALKFFRIPRWAGELHGKEGQALEWQDVNAFNLSPMLPANAPVFKALSLPSEYAITFAGEGPREWVLGKIERGFQRGLRLVQVREKNMSAEDRRAFASEVIALARRFEAQVLINSDSEIARVLGADGVHMSASQLAELTSRPDFPLCGASCHSREELEHAEALGFDFAVLSPVLPTATHPAAPTLGWTGFVAQTEGLALPVYALGGMRPESLTTAWRHGAHGIAMLREAWR